MTTYGYIRTDAPGRRAQAEAQRAAIEGTSEAMGATLRRVFLDECPGEADLLARPGMAGLLASVREGDTIIVASADRIARAAEVLLAFMDWARDHRVVIHWADLDRSTARHHRG